MISVLHFNLTKEYRKGLKQSKLFDSEKNREFLHPEIMDFFSQHVDINSTRTKIIDALPSFNIEIFEKAEVDSFINLRRVNNLRYLNKYFEAVNRQLRTGSVFIGCVETYDQKKGRIYGKYPFGISHVYYLINFIYKRIFPKWLVTQKLYFNVTKGKNRMLSKTEVLGRLVACGFGIVEVKDINGYMYFVTRKFSSPEYNMNPSYGLILKMKKKGKYGKYIKVIKLRTMHPFAEYLQDYVYSLNNLDEGGKFKDDFRITVWGKILRRFKIDEIPMLINFIKGDLKLVGIRPLSDHYLSLYDVEFRNHRNEYKPGLIPPFYADMPKKLEDIILSEKKYLDLFDKNPVRTDIKYFFKCIYNILFKFAFLK